MDKKQRINIIITAGAAALVILFLVYSIKILGKKSNASNGFPISAPATSTSGNIVPTALEEKSTGEIAYKKDSALVWKRCPFSGHNYFKEEKEELVISGIIWDEVNPHTIINGQILGEGESVGSFIIERIEKQKVILSDGAKTVELQI